jgi:hypothetical protein
MQHTNILPRAFALLLLPAFGCVTDEADVDLEATDEVATVEQSLAGTNMSFHECDQAFGLPCFVDLGSAANNRACFLGGIYGRLGDGGGVLIYRELSTNTYKMMLSAPSGSKIAAMAVCVSGGTNRDSMSWTAGNPYATLPATSSNRRCFLQSISSFDDVAFNDTTDYMHVWKSGSTWYLGGQISGGAQPMATAVCIDTPYATGAYGGVANLGYTVGGNLVDNASGGWACGLAKLGGKFMSSSYGDKVAIGYNATTKFWNWTLVNGKQAEAVCVK